MTITPTTASNSKLPQWFEYPIRVQPHHTDYGGVVWHGTYITWMESARVECLRAVGVPFDQFIKLGYDLPVVDLKVRYKHPLRLGADAIVKTRLLPTQGIRLKWQYEIVLADDTSQRCLSAEVALVTVDVTKRRIVKRLPSEIEALLKRLSDYFASET